MQVPQNRSGLGALAPVDRPREEIPRGVVCRSKNRRRNPLLLALLLFRPKVIFRFRLRADSKNSKRLAVQHRLGRPNAIQHRACAFPLHGESAHILHSVLCVFQVDEVRLFSLFTFHFSLFEEILTGLLRRCNVRWMLGWVFPMKAFPVSLVAIEKSSFKFRFAVLLLVYYRRLAHRVVEQDPESVEVTVQIRNDHRFCLLWLVGKLNAAFFV